MVFLVAGCAVWCLLRTHLPLVLLTSVFPRPSLLIGSVSSCQLLWDSFCGRGGHTCFLRARGRSMRWCLLLLWAQALRQAPLLASGAGAGRLGTAGNISAEEGGSVTLQCHLSSTAATVTQVDWKQRDRFLAIHHAESGWFVYPAFTERVVPRPNLGLTLQALTANDTGLYSCIYHTFPDGIYRGRLFLEVLRSSGAGHRPGLLLPLLGVLLLAAVCAAVTAVVTLARKKKFLRIRSAESGLRSVPCGPEEWGLGVPASPASCVWAEAAAAAGSGSCREQRDDDYDEPHDYFNVLSYRSLGDISFPAETC